MSKFGNIRVETDGYSFASKLELAVYGILKLRHAAHELEILQTQDTIYLTLAEIEYRPDFKCLDTKTGEVFWVEAKGFADPKWPLKRRLWRFYGPGKLEIWDGTYHRPRLKEIIDPSTQTVKKY